MLKLDIVQQSFAAGEVTPALQSREDLAKQQIALKTCLNAIVTSTGSVINRGGFLKVDEVEDSSEQHRLMNFEFSTEQAYPLVWGDEVLMIIKNGATVLRSLVGSIYKWTVSGSGTSEYYLDIIAGGDPGLLETHYILENSSKMTAGTVGSLVAGEWDFGDNDALGFNTFYVRLADSTDPDSKAAAYVQIPYLIASPYSAGLNNASLYDAQSADVMYLATKYFTPYKLTRTGDAAWTLGAIAFQDGPYKARIDGDEDIVFTPAARTGNGITVEVSEAISWPSVGLPIALGYDNPLDSSILEWSWAKVASIVDTDTITVDIQEDLGFEYLLNPDFKDGLAFWEDKSTAVSTISYDQTTNAASFDQGASGIAYLTQQTTVNAYEKLDITVVVDSIGGGGTLRVSIGNTALAFDVLPIQAIVAPGTYTYTSISAQPTGGTVHITMNTFGGTPTYSHKVSSVSVKRHELATSNWRRGAWDSDLGWPNVVSLFEQAVWYANNSDQPDTFWKTKTGEYESFTFNTPPFDTDSVSATLASEKVNAIQWIRQFGELVMGTTGEEWRVQAGPGSSTITPLSIDAKSKSKTGSASIKPIIAGNSLLFLNRNANKIFVLTYSFDADGFKPINLTVLAPHLLENNTITEWAYQEDPNSVIWCIRDDGVMLGLTYDEAQDIWAFSRHVTDGKFESLCVVPESGVDVLYVEVRRVLIESGARVTKRFIEKMMPRIANEDIYDYFFVDSGVTLDIETGISVSRNITAIAFSGTKVQVRHLLSEGTLNENDYIYISNIVGTTELNQKTFRVADWTNLGAGVAGFFLKDREGDDYIDATNYSEWVSGGEVRLGITTITDLDHLNGKTVAVLADGSALTKTVAPLVGGGIGYTLTTPAIVVHSGLPYNTDIETLPHDYVSGDGSTSQGTEKSLIKANIYFNKSTGTIKVGSDDTEADFQELQLNNQSSGNNPPPLFTGVEESTVIDGQSKITQTFIRNDKPLPVEIVGIISEVGYGEK